MGVCTFVAGTNIRESSVAVINLVFNGIIV